MKNLLSKCLSSYFDPQNASVFDWTWHCSQLSSTQVNSSEPTTIASHIDGYRYRYRLVYRYGYVVKQIDMGLCASCLFFASVYNNILSHFITLVMCNVCWQRQRETVGSEKPSEQSSSGGVIMWDTPKRVGGRECVYILYSATISPPPAPPTMCVSLFHCQYWQ